MAVAAAIIMVAAVVASTAVTIHQMSNQPKAPELPPIPPVPEPPAPSVVPPDSGAQDLQDMGGKVRDIQRRRLSATSSASPTQLNQSSVGKVKTLLGE